MKLIRGWEHQYSPAVTGGVRLNKGKVYRGTDESDGIGDQREGEFRVALETSASVHWDQPSLREGLVSKETLDAADLESIRQLYAEQFDDPNVEVTALGDGQFKVIQNVKMNTYTMEDVGRDGPYLLCLSREPTGKVEWESLRAALPDRYDTWTITDDLDSLQFEIECGIKRWFSLNEISYHKIGKARAWVSYSYDSAPPSGEVGELVQMNRWLRKSRRYRHQGEYRFLWEITSPQMPTFPDSIDIELTKTGLALFKPWEPPTA